MIRSTRLIWPLALVAALFGIALRCWHIAAEPLWLDEAYSAYAAGKGFAFLWDVVPRYETHPPFYYSLLRLWTLPFGDSLAALRSIGLLCGLVSLPLAIVAMREVTLYLGLDERHASRARAAILALVALSPMLIDMSRQVRPYPLMILVMIAQILILFRMAGRPIGGRCYAAYLVLLAVTLWLHNLGALHASAMGLAFLLLMVRRNWSRSEWIAFIGGHLLVAAAWLPAILILADQAPSWVSATWLTFSGWLVKWGLVALWSAPPAYAKFAAGLLFLLGLPALARRGRPGRALAALLVLAAVPAIAAIAISMTISPVFLPRTLTPATPAALMLVALGFALTGRRLLALLALLLLLFEMGSYATRARRIGSRYDYYGAVSWLQQRYRPGDLIFAYPNEGALPLGFALRDKGVAIPIRAIPTPVPTLDGGPGSWYRSGSRGVVSLTPARLTAIAREPQTRAIPTIWLYRLGPWAYDKGDHLVHALEAEGRVSVGTFRNGPIDIIGLRVSPAAPAVRPASR